MGKCLKPQHQQPLEGKENSGASREGLGRAEWSGPSARQAKIKNSIFERFF
jgi:hypothetical protein